MHYRKEVDGLRALAVLPVMLFHAGFESFSGGFVGVDVFFVISGYLITTIILVELEQKKFSIIDFYERRARRILPALFFVIFICIPFAWFWMLPSDMKDFSQSLVAVSVFASNILFWYESGYFEAAAELKPLLHTWSLAVEEQYYVLFPLFLMLCWRLGKCWILILLSAIFLVSLSLAQWGSLSKPAAAFFLLPTRGWELLIGAFAAFYLSRENKNEFSRLVSEPGGWIGLALIVFSVFAYSKATSFLGLYALVPTIGALFIILFATDKTTIGKFLGNKVFVGIGLISYSAYLWHQPLFAFAKHRSLSEPGPLVYAALSVLALILAYFSWRYVEKPFRNKNVVNRFELFSMAIFVSLLFIATGSLININDGYRNRLPQNLVWQSLGEKLDAKGNICVPNPLDSSLDIKVCEFGDLKADHSVLLYGDSHAQAISEALHKELLKKNIKGIKVEIDGCRIVPQVIDTKANVREKSLCSAKFQTLLSYIKSVNSDVIVVSRWSFGLYPIDHVITDMPYTNSEGGVEREDYREYAVNINGGLDYGVEAKGDALKQLIEGLLSTGVKVFLVYPVPEIAWDIARVNWRYYQENGVKLRHISIPYSDFIKRNHFVNSVFNSFVGSDNFIPILPESIFCNTFLKDRCVAQYDSVPFYYDDDHLSDLGASYIVNDLMKEIQVRLENSL